MNGLVLSERDAQQRIVDEASLYGWRVHAERPAFTTKGYRTPVQGHPGFPDLVLVHPNVGVRFVELKIGTDLTDDQQRWGDALLAAGADWTELRLDVAQLNRYCLSLRDAVRLP